ncbi:unnamed protein product, partial [Meganyctiphanes norvegica]
ALLRIRPNCKHKMNIFVVSSLLACAMAAPQQFDQIPVAILSQDNSPNELGNFAHNFEAENGIVVQGQGFAGSAGQTNMEGSYSFPLPDGSFAEVRYVADENGFRVESPLLPVAPPAPPHVAELLRIAEEQRAQGIVFN